MLRLASSFDIMKSSAVVMNNCYCFTDGSESRDCARSGASLAD